MKRVSGLTTRPWLLDLLGLGLLGLFAWVSLGFLVRDDLYLYGDNPGQFVRLWYTLRTAVPLHGRLLDWNPWWYAGYPELQFYPPGFVLAGLALDWLTLGRLSPVLLYQTLMFGAYLLPGLTCYWLVTQLGLGRAAGLTAGFLALIFPDIWGGVGGLFIGMLGARLAFGLFPLAVMFGLRAADGERPLTNVTLLGLTVGFILLAHPFHALAPALALGMYVVGRGVLACTGEAGNAPFRVGAGFPCPRGDSVGGSDWQGNPAPTRNNDAPTHAEQAACPAPGFIPADAASSRGGMIAGMNPGAGHAGRTSPPGPLSTAVGGGDGSVNGPLPPSIAMGRGSGREVRPLLRVAAGFALGVALAAFWLLPLLAHREYALPLLRAPFSDFPNWLGGGRLPFFALLALCALPTMLSAREPRVRAALWALALLPPVLLGVIVADYAVLVDRLGFYTLDPIRFMDELYLAVTLLAALGLVNLARLAAGALAGDGWWAWAGRAAVVAGLYLLVWQPFPGMVEEFRPGPNKEPRFLSQASADYHLDELWRELASEQGRVLFTSAETRFQGRGAAWPSFIKAATPYFAGREIIGGTFTHWTPIARLVWQGERGPVSLQGRVETSDDQSLFGTPWNEMTDERLAGLCRKLDVATLVTSRDDINARTFLDKSPSFQSYWNNGYFFLYRLRDYRPSFIARPERLQASVLAYAGDRLVVHVAEADGQSWLDVKVMYYPNWRVTVDGAMAGDARPNLRFGTSVPVADDLGLMQVKPPRGQDYTLTLEYEPGTVEQAGQTVSVMALLACAGLPAAGRLWNRAGRPGRQA